MEAIRNVVIYVPSHLLMAYFHLRPLAPYLRKVLNGPEVDLGSFLKHLSGAFQLPLCFTLDATFLVEFGEVDVESVKICGGFPRVYRG